MLRLYSQPHVTENIPALLWSSPHGSSHSDSDVIGEPSFVPPESSQCHALPSADPTPAKSPLGPQAPELLVPAVTCGPKDITCFLSLLSSLSGHTWVCPPPCSVMRARSPGWADVVFVLGNSLLRAETNVTTKAAKQGLRNFQ